MLNAIANTAKRVKNSGALMLGIASVTISLGWFVASLSALVPSGGVALGSALFGGLLLIVTAFGIDPRKPGPDSPNEEGLS